IVHRSSFIVSILNGNDGKRRTSSHVHRSSFIVHRFHPERREQARERGETEHFVPCSSFIVHRSSFELHHRSSFSSSPFWFTLSRMIEKIDEAVRYIRERSKVQPEVGVILGSGLGDVVD